MFQCFLSLRNLSKASVRPLLLILFGTRVLKPLDGAPLLLSVWMSPSVMYRCLQCGRSCTTPRNWENLGDFECKIFLLPYKNKCWSSVYYDFDSGGWLDSKATEEGQLERGVSLCAITGASLAELKHAAEQDPLTLALALLSLPGR